MFLVFSLLFSIIANSILASTLSVNKNFVSKVIQNKSLTPKKEIQSEARFNAQNIKFSQSKAILLLSSPEMEEYEEIQDEKQLISFLCELNKIKVFLLLKNRFQSLTRVHFLEFSNFPFCSDLNIKNQVFRI